MKNVDETHLVQDLIARYERELLATYRRRGPEQAAAAPPQPDPRQKPQPDTGWLDRDYPAPNIPRDRAALAAGAPAAAGAPPASPADAPHFPYTDEDLHGEVPVPQPAPGQAAAQDAPSEGAPAMPFLGYLRVFVFTGQTAEPLPGAHVKVWREGTGENEGEQALFAHTQTDEDGLTPVIPLPTVDPAATMAPSADKAPFTLYSVRVDATGFSPAIYTDLPIYGGIGVTQPAGMYPLIPGTDPDLPVTFRSGGPADL